MFTIPQAARICRVSTNTVKRWVDHGRLPGSYILPATNGGPCLNHRRIPREALARFMDTHGMPLRWLEEG